MFRVYATEGAEKVCGLLNFPDLVNSKTSCSILSWRSATKVQTQSKRAN